MLAREAAAELVRSARVGRGDLVLDLGAGTGALTVPLARTGARVVAVERSPRLAARLRRRFDGDPGVRVVEGDMRTVPLPRRPYRVVSNLPFSIAMTMLGRLLDDPRRAPQRADLVVPWHLAARLCDDRRHRRSRRWHRRYDLRIARRLPPAAFRPPPSVVAGVLVAERRACGCSSSCRCRVRPP